MLLEPLPVPLPELLFPRVRLGEPELSSEGLVPIEPVPLDPGETPPGVTLSGATAPGVADPVLPGAVDRDPLLSELGDPAPGVAEPDEPVFEPVESFMPAPVVPVGLLRRRPVVLESLPAAVLPEAALPVLPLPLALLLPLPTPEPADWAKATPPATNPEIRTAIIVFFMVFFMRFPFVWRLLPSDSGSQPFQAPYHPPKPPPSRPAPPRSGPFALRNAPGRHRDGA